MATFTPARCGDHNHDYAYTFHFQNQSTTTTIFYWLEATFSPQPNFSPTIGFQVVSGSIGQVEVPPGQTSSCNFNTNGQLQAGQPPFLGILGPGNKPIAYVCARFWTGGTNPGAIIGATTDALKAGMDLVSASVDAVVEEDPYAAIASSVKAGLAVAQAAATIGSNENQYINLIVNPQSGSGGWSIPTTGSENDTTGDEVATNNVGGINMTVRVDGGGVDNPTTQNIYFHYSDDAS